MKGAALPGRGISAGGMVLAAVGVERRRRPQRGASGAFAVSLYPCMAMTDIII